MLLQQVLASASKSMGGCPRCGAGIQRAEVATQTEITDHLADSTAKQVTTGLRTEHAEPPPLDASSSQAAEASEQTPSPPRIPRSPSMGMGLSSLGLSMQLQNTIS